MSKNTQAKKDFERGNNELQKFLALPSIVPKAALFKPWSLGKEGIGEDFNTDLHFKFACFEGLSNYSL